VRSWERQEEYSGVEYNVPFREESCRSSCIYSGPLHSHSRDDVSQHPSTRTGAESIQLIYSGRALQALSDLARQFRCHPIFWREFSIYQLIPSLTWPHNPQKSRSCIQKYDKENHLRSVKWATLQRGSHTRWTTPWEISFIPSNCQGRSVKKTSSQNLWPRINLN